MKICIQRCFFSYLRVCTDPKKDCEGLRCEKSSLYVRFVELIDMPVCSCVILEHCILSAMLYCVGCDMMFAGDWKVSQMENKTRPIFKES